VPGSPRSSPMSLVELFRRFVHPLNELGVPYMTTGAVAAVIYGEPRLTLDVDLVLRLSPEHVLPLVEAFSPNEFYVPPVEVIREEAGRPVHGHFNLLHHATGLRADIYLAGEDPLDAWGLERRRKETIAGEAAWIAPAEYVIVRKLESYREGGSSKHLTDIRAMLRIRPDLVDRDALERIVRERRLDREWSLV
jgi:hypothetical protein